jgi:hypothetical protein
MALITKNDLVTHVYSELIDVITRTTDSIVTKAIAAAEGEVKAHLTRFDVAAITDEYFFNLLKDVACWHLVRLANPNIDLALFRTIYEDAKKTLLQIHKGLLVPEWPLKADDPDTAYDEAGHVEFTSNTKRTNHY